MQFERKKQIKRKMGCRYKYFAVFKSIHNILLFYFCIAVYKHGIQRDSAKCRKSRHFMINRRKTKEIRKYHQVAINPDFYLWAY